MSDTPKVSEAVARPIRTAVQIAPSAAITEFVDAFFWDMTDRQYAALIVILTLAFGTIQAVVENSTGKAWWLRQIPPVEVPVVEGDDK